MERNQPSESANHQMSPEIRERRSGEFRTTLTQITTTPATIELLHDNAYTEQAISQLITLNEQVLQTFKKSGSQEVFASDRAREDAAFNYFNLPDLAGILTQISQFNDKLQQLDQLLQSKQDNSLLTKIDTVFVPPDEKTFKRGKQNQELAPKLLIDRTKAVLVALSENFGVDVFDPAQLQISEGSVTDHMMRQTPYRFLDIPALQRQILVNDEEGNATFVFDSSKLRELQVSMASLREAMGKRELKNLITTHPGIGQTLIYSESFIQRLIKAIEQPTSQSKRQQAEKENADYLQPVEAAPEGWLNAFQISLELGVAPSTMTNKINQLTFSNLDYKEYKHSNTRHMYTYYSPQAVEQIRQAFGESLIIAPEGWLKVQQIGSEFGLNTETVRAKINQLNFTDLEYREYKNLDTGKLAMFYSPQAVERLRRAFGEKLEIEVAPAGWLTAKQIGKAFEASRRTVRKAIEQIKATDVTLDARQYKDQQGNVWQFYSPQDQEKINQQVRELLSFQKAPEGWKTIRQISLHFGVDRITIKRRLDKLGAGKEILQARQYLDDKGRLFEYYSPQVTEQIAQKLAERREEKT